MEKLRKHKKLCSQKNYTFAKPKVSKKLKNLGYLNFSTIYNCSCKCFFCLKIHEQINHIFSVKLNF